MGIEVNSNEKIKHNMEVAMEWMSYLGYHISSVSVYDFGITLIADDEYSIAISNKIFEIAEEKGLEFNVSRNSDNDFLYYTSDEIGLDIVFTD